VVHSSDILIRTIKLPIMSRSNILKSIEWELRNYTKGAITDYYIGYDILGKEQVKVQEIRDIREQGKECQKGHRKENKVFKVFFVVVPKTIIDQYESLAKLIGAQIKCIEIASICAARFLQGLSKSYFVMDFGYESVRISLYEGNSIFADRELLFKKPNNLEGSAIKTNASSSNVFLNSIPNKNLEDIFKNISQMTDYYLSIDTNHNISAIYTSGGLAVDSRVCEFVENTSETASTSITDYKRIQADHKLNQNINIFTNVIGLLLRK
jgi:Tfp pilus assembly PilM family ATPase